MGTLDMWNGISGNHNNELKVLDTLAKARGYASYVRVRLLKVND